MKKIQQLSFCRIFGIFERNRAKLLKTLEHFTVKELIELTKRFNGFLFDEALFITRELEIQKGYFQYPSRLDVYFLILCIKGSFNVSVNLRDFTIEKGMAMVYTPECILQINESNRAVIRTVAITESFLQSIHIDPKMIFSPLVNVQETPCWKLTDNELKIIDNYMHLIRSIYILPEETYKSEMIRGVISSVVFLFVHIWKRESTAVKEIQDPRDRTARHFSHFMELLQKHHNQEHHVAFYADRMCMTPKYLSSLIKDHSGRSAAEWIDQYLILEAKSLLKYSGKSVKEITDALHFSDSSFFCKYFKKKTGITPTEYKKM
jgi:AraC family transcriptional regulator, transcriptional activator of pobA